VRSGAWWCASSRGAPRVIEASIVDVNLLKTQIHLKNRLMKFAHEAAAFRNPEQV
jgi:hypothetical protein